MTLSSLNLDFFHIPLIDYKCDGTITFIQEKYQFNIKILYVRKKLDNYMLNIPTCTLLTP